ncbi:MAG: phage holin family protein [Gallionella sp.]|nr:phage holin family protein [Gallionella sp.]
MTEKISGRSTGLLNSLSTFAATLAAIVQTRLELLSTDMEEDRVHYLSLLMLVLAALFCLGVGVVLATILLVAVFWDTQRILVLGLLAGLFLTGGIAAGLFAIHKVKTKPKIFSASLLELFKDRQQLVSRL